ncbi:MAG: hypothetical protein DIU84_09310, partial [Bacillota bacterium]
MRRGLILSLVGGQKPGCLLGRVGVLFVGGRLAAAKRVFPHAGCTRLPALHVALLSRALGALCA